MINITVPVYNEEAMLKRSITALVAFCKENISDSYAIVIADNQSTDKTSEIASQLAADFPQVTYCNAGVKGKGAGIVAGWGSVSADVYCFMDADLATDLAALPALLEAAKSGVAIGSRFHKNSQVKRSMLRKLFSFGYRSVARLLIGTKISDLPCGFKACNQEVFNRVVPETKDRAWFFDSELVLAAEKIGFTITEIPVQWEDPREAGDESRVQTVSLSIEYFKKIVDLKKRLAS